MSYTNKIKRYTDGQVLIDDQPYSINKLRVKYNGLNVIICHPYWSTNRIVKETAATNLYDDDAAANFADLAAFKAYAKKYLSTSSQAQNANGLSMYRLISAATTNSNVISATVANVYTLHLDNKSATVPAYVKLYNKATAPTVGTDTPVAVFKVGVASSRDINLSAYGVLFGTGLGIAISADIADAGTTAVAAAEVIVDLTYKN